MLISLSENMKEADGELAGCRGGDEIITDRRPHYAAVALSPSAQAPGT